MTALTPLHPLTADRYRTARLEGAAGEGGPRSYVITIARQGPTYRGRPVARLVTLVGCRYDDPTTTIRRVRGLWGIR